MRAWIEPDPEYVQGGSYLEIETYEDGKFVTGSYMHARRLPWHIEDMLPFDDYAE